MTQVAHFCENFKSPKFLELFHVCEQAMEERGRAQEKRAIAFERCRTEGIPKAPPFRGKV